MHVLIKIEERGGLPPRLVRMESAQVRIGRKAEDNQLVLKKRSVSRKHAVIARQDGRFIVADLKSAGGTFVNGDRVTAPRVIRPGDRVAIGEYLLSIVIDPAGSSEFEQESTSEIQLKPTTGDLHPRDDVAFADAGDEVTLHHADGGADRDHFDEAVLAAAFANIPAGLRTGDEEVSASAFVQCDPRVFPGGDLGSLVVANALGRLAAVGAEPRALTLDLVLEEGFSIQELHRHLRSIRTGVWDERVQTRVRSVDVQPVGASRGAAIRYEAQGARVLDMTLSPAPGDVVLVSGTVGAHGVSLASLRSQAHLDQEVFSDVDATTLLVRALAEAEVPVRAVRYPFAGGIAHGLADIARRHRVRILLDEGTRLFEPAVEAASLTLDLDARFAASAGRLLIVVPQAAHDAAREVWHAAGHEPIALGKVLAPDDRLGSVVVGTERRYKPLRRELTPDVSDPLE